MMRVELTSRHWQCHVITVIRHPHWELSNNKHCSSSLIILLEQDIRIELTSPDWQTGILNHYTNPALALRVGLEPT